MVFQVGDTVVHWSYGPSRLVKMDEKTVSGEIVRYYVIETGATGGGTGSMTIWVPETGDEASSGLRRLTPEADFERLFAILKSPGEPLSADRMERKGYLLKQLRDGTIESVCHVIRDLTEMSRTTKLNDVDATLLARARKFLVEEWALARSISQNQAEREMDELLTPPIEDTSTANA